MANEYKSSLARYRRYLQTVKERPLLGASLWVIMTLVLIIVMILTALRPTLITIAELWGQIQQRQEMTAKLDEKIAGMQKVASILAEQKNNFVLLDEALPSEPRWESLAGDLTAMASLSGVTISKMSWGAITVSGEKAPEKADKKSPVTIPEGVSVIQFTINCGGEYSQMEKMIGLMENGKRLIKITNISINKAKDVLTVNINGLAAYAKEAAL